ncbi:YlbF/YmcA family competence regulator [Alkaliphilus crotonatoxidans]
MNVYDQAHQLAKALKESEEYKTFKELDLKLKANPEIKGLMNDFRKRQFEVQSAQMMGQRVADDKLERLKELDGILMQDPVVSEYMHAELRFTRMMTDVYKILGESMDLDEIFGHDIEA